MPSLISLYSFGGSFGGNRRVVVSLAVEPLIAPLAVGGCLFGVFLFVRCLNVNCKQG